MRVALPRRAPVALFLLLAACATPHPGSMKVAEADPWEATNRKIYGFNKRADKYALRPIAQTYRTVMPTAGRRGLSNAYHNYQEPLSFVNAVLQGKMSEAFNTLGRFLINTTLGVGGLADHATGMGLPERKEDFGQTFAWWGINSGPYVMMPFFGPRTLLDTAGLGSDIFLDPADLTRQIIAHTGPFGTLAIYGGKSTISRANLIEAGADGLLGDSLDEYATLRSAYLQSRKSDIWDGSPPDDEEFEDAPLAPGGTPQPVVPAPKP